jgi:zinc transporter ZupT
MGIISCIIFGILGSWTTRSIQLRAGTGGIKAVFIIGLLSALIGMAGVLIGWGDIKSFNLYNILLTISVSALLTIVWSKLQPARQRVEY